MTAIIYTEVYTTVLLLIKFILTFIIRLSKQAVYSVYLSVPSGYHCHQVFLPVWLLSIQPEAGGGPLQTIPPPKYPGGGEERRLRPVRPAAAARFILPQSHTEGKKHCIVVK